LPGGVREKTTQKKHHALRVGLTRFTQVIRVKTAERPTKQPFLTDGTPGAETGTNGVDTLSRLPTVAATVSP
jgi:hypothetical protein